MKRLFSLLLAVALPALAAFADVRLPDAPKTKKKIESNLTIQFDTQAKEARLVIPRDQLAQLRAELDGLDIDADRAAFTGFSRAQTIASGLFLSLAFVFGGVWLARTRGTAGERDKTSRLVAGGLVLFAAGAAASICFANAGPPPELRTISSRLFDQQVFRYWRAASGKITVEVADEGTRGIRLIVPHREEDETKKDEE